MIDTLCHLDCDEYDADRNAVLLAAAQAGVHSMINPAITATGWEKILALTSATPALYPALGLHPCFVAEHSSVDLERLDQLLSQEQAIIALGEIGLDFSDKAFNQEQQIALFIAQLQLAAKYDLPVILHIRKAHDAAIQLLRAHPVRGGTVHAFNGSLQQGMQYHALGFCLGFGGMLTYERSRKLHALARALPQSALVLETDSPDMTGQAHRGSRNSPAYLPEVRDSLAVLRHESAEEVATYTTANAQRVFRLPLV